MHGGDETKTVSKKGRGPFGFFFGRQQKDKKRKLETVIEASLTLDLSLPCQSEKDESEVQIDTVFKIDNGNSLIDDEMFADNTSNNSWKIMKKRPKSQEGDRPRTIRF